MQRWIVLAVVGAILFGLGGGFALWTYRQNRPQKVWVPVVLNQNLPEDKQKELAAKIEEKLREGDLLLQVVKDTRLASKLGLPSDHEAEGEVRKRLFVEVSEVDVPADNGATNRVPAINVGIHAQRKSFDSMGEVAMRIMKDVWKMLGIKEPAAPTI